MRVLFIGGTGNISTWVSKLAVERGIDLFLLNRGKTQVDIAGATTITGDINQPEQVQQALKDLVFDAVVNWIAFDTPHIERDLDLFRGKTRQYVFISSASAYQKPSPSPFITESTPLYNPFWEYSRKKIACEDRLMAAYRAEGFPITIVRPSHTYGKWIPTTVGSAHASAMIERMRDGRPIVVHGDGTSLWVITHAADFARAFVPLLGLPQAIGHAVHITSDEVLTWNQIHTITADAVGGEANIVHVPSDFINTLYPNMGAGLLGDKAHSVIFDNTKIKTLVPGWRATIPFAQGVRQILESHYADQNHRANPASHAIYDDMLSAYQK